MEVSPPPDAAKRLWNIVRIAFFMIRKGISKWKLMVDLHLMMKRGKIASKKAIGSLMFHHHHSNFSCRTSDVHVSGTRSYYAPREYEFSCSNSPAFPFLVSNRRKNHHHSQNRYRHHFSCIPSEDDIAVLHKTLEMLNADISGDVSPVSVLPGFGKSPVVRQLRITDSPFPLKDVADDNCHVDKKAEEFIQGFYEQLRLQKRMAALEAMYQEMLMVG